MTIDLWCLEDIVIFVYPCCCKLCVQASLGTHVRLPAIRLGIGDEQLKLTKTNCSLHSSISLQAASFQQNLESQHSYSRQIQTVQLLLRCRNRFLMLPTLPLSQYLLVYFIETALFYLNPLEVISGIRGKSLQQQKRYTVVWSALFYGNTY